MTDYLEWQSQLSAEQIFAQSESISYPTPWREGVLYLTSLIDEGGRSSLLYRAYDTSKKPRVLVPAPFSLRTRICEYGGKPFWLIGDILIFVNDADQCLYQLDLNDSQQAVARLCGDPKAPGRYRFADVVPADENFLFAVVEEVVDHEPHPISYLASLRLHQINAEPHRLPASGDFFSNLVTDPSRQQVAWVQWQHPNMPWDETELWVCDYTTDERGLQLGTARELKPDGIAAICQLCFAGNGVLFLVMDFAAADSTARNYWNIYCVDPQANSNEFSLVTKEHREYGYPHWQYGDHRLVAAGDSTAIAIGSNPDGDVLSVIDTENLAVRHLDHSAVRFQNLAADRSGTVTTLAKYIDRSPAIIELSTNSRKVVTRYQLPQPASCSNIRDISEPEHLSYKVGREKHAYAYYYPPKNSRYRVAEHPPPLLVMVHGGPTAQAYNHFDLQKQFWTQRGFAVVDINHQGSSGYGREFRDALYGEWGVADIDDIESCIQHLVANSKANPRQIAIRGKSAGGYAVLRALTELPQTFSAGACYYGIGNLVTLAASTHKFEAYYTNRLIGEKYASGSAQRPDSRFHQRSPINKVASLKTPMIVFQGGEDKVVPPAVAHEITGALKQQNLPYKYVEYAAEGHGFRDPANNIDAWQKELNFYRTHLLKEQS